MPLKDTFSSAVRAVWSAPLRSVLTMLGIMAGVAAVVLLVGLGSGLRSGFDQSFQQVATRITVQKAGAGQPGIQLQPLTEGDLAAVERAAPSVITRVIPLRTGSAVLRRGNVTYVASLAGASSDYAVLNSRTMAAGTFYGADADATGARVVVLGPDAATYLFGGDITGAIGQEVSVGRIRARVVGVMTPAGQVDNVAVVPLRMARALLAGADTLNGIGVTAADPTSVPEAIAAIYRSMDRQHRIHDIGSRDYQVSAAVVQLDRIGSFIRFISFFVVGVAALALLVGGIGIGNIMLVSVTERTREIGVLKALGARRRTVVGQFLAESVLLAGTGGVIGAAAGIGLTLLGRSLVARYVPQSGPLQVSPAAVVVAVAVSVLIGLLAGGFPAYRAARLRPVEALRH